MLEKHGGKTSFSARQSLVFRTWVMPSCIMQWGECHTSKHLPNCFVQWAEPTFTIILTDVGLWTPQGSVVDTVTSQHGACGSNLGLWLLCVKFVRLQFYIFSPGPKSRRSGEAETPEKIEWVRGINTGGERQSWKCTASLLIDTHANTHNNQ